MKKSFLLICIFIVILITFSGCYDARGVEELAYVTALGIDISDNDELTLTFQISIPSSSKSPDSESSQSSQTNIVSVKCKSFNSGISLANDYISKEIDLSHCKAIVISEKLAKKGLSPHIQSISNNIELRPNCSIIITKCDPKDFLENSKSEIESLTARYYEVEIQSSEYTGFIPVTKLIDFIEGISNNTIQASAILGNMNDYSEDNEQKKDINISLNNNYLAGETPTMAKDNAESFGTAVFKDDKLVGQLTGFETILHLIISNKLGECTISVPSANENDSNIDLKITQSKKTKISVDTDSDNPIIYIDVFLEGFGVSLDKNINYESIEQIEKINSTTELFLKNKFENYLNKTSKDFNSDIDGFGKKAIMNFLTIDKWLDYNWLDKYKDAEFRVNVNVNIKGGNKFNKSP